MAMINNTYTTHSTCQVLSSSLFRASFFACILYNNKKNGPKVFEHCVGILNGARSTSKLPTLIVFLHNYVVILHTCMHLLHVNLEPGSYMKHKVPNADVRDVHFTILPLWM